MLNLTINGKEINDRRALHRAFAEGLSFPDYYGGNLDALYDCLTDLHEPTEIRLMNFGLLEAALGKYASVLRRVLFHAMEENPRIRLVFECDEPCAADLFDDSDD